MHVGVAMQAIDPWRYLPSLANPGLAIDYVMQYCYFTEASCGQPNVSRTYARVRT